MNWKKLFGQASTRTKTPSVEVEGEEFFIEQRGNVWTISHPTWSLVGSGKTKEAALKDLRYEASIVLEAYADDYPEGLTESAQDMVDYCLEIFENHRDHHGNCKCFSCNIQ